MAEGDIYRGIVNGQVQGEPTTLTTWWRVLNDLGESDLEVAAGLRDELFGRYILAYLPILSSDHHMVNVVCNKVSPEPWGPTSTIYAAASDNGQEEVDAVPQLAAAVISFQSAIGGPSYRGRCYMPGVPQDKTDSGILIESFYTDLAAATETFFADLTTAGGTMLRHAIWSRKLETAEEVVARVVRPNLGTQRRRRPRPSGIVVAETAPPA